MANPFMEVLEKERLQKGDTYSKAILADLKTIKEHLIELKKKVDSLKK